VNKPPGDPSNCSPAGFSPYALQTIDLFEGKAGFGVQVNTVLFPFHTLVVGKVWKVVKSVKSTLVKSGFIGSLNVKTNGPDGDAPFAGGGDVSMGAAWPRDGASKAQLKSNKDLKCIGFMNRLPFK
jgi:hypothetical protein